MKYEITEPKKKEIKEYAKIYCEAFNGEPWKEHWTEDIAEKRILDFLHQDNFYGLVLKIEKTPVCMIFGEYRVMDTGMTFEAIDLFLDPKEKGNGYGLKLFSALCDNLKEQGVKEVSFLTLRNSFLPEYYKKIGFAPSDYLHMSKKL